MSLFVNLLVIDVATWQVRYPSPRPISSCKLVEGDRFETHVLICLWHFNLRRDSSNRSISAAACSCHHLSIGLHDVTRPEADFSWFFLSFPCVSKYIHIYPRWSFWIGFRVCSRTLCHGSMVIALFSAEKGLPGSLPCLLRRRNGAEVCVFYLVSEIVSAQYFFESLSEPKTQWLPACPAGSRVWMTTVQSGRLVMGNQTMQCKELVETKIEYCWQLIASIATAFCQLLWPYLSTGYTRSQRKVGRSQQWPCCCPFSWHGWRKVGGSGHLAQWFSLVKCNQFVWLKHIEATFLQHTHTHIFIYNIYLWCTFIDSKPARHRFNQKKQNMVALTGFYCVLLWLKYVNKLWTTHFILPKMFQGSLV